MPESDFDSKEMEAPLRKSFGEGRETETPKLRLEVTSPLERILREVWQGNESE